MRLTEDLSELSAQEPGLAWLEKLTKTKDTSRFGEVAMEVLKEWAVERPHLAGWISVRQIQALIYLSKLEDKQVESFLVAEIEKSQAEHYRHLTPEERWLASEAGRIIFSVISRLKKELT